MEYFLEEYVEILGNMSFVCLRVTIFLQINKGVHIN